MAKPAGMLSLTYHLAYTDDVRTEWGAADGINSVLQEFGITDAFLKSQIHEINNRLGTANADERRHLAERWMHLLLEDLLRRHTDPRILW